MDTNAKVPPVQPVTEPPKSQTTTDAPSPNQEAAAASLAIPPYIAEPINYRLEIDTDPITGSFIYRTVDRATGETVSQYPSEELVRMRDSGAYKAGTVFNGKV
jgi:flagellar protein FlaG